MSKSKICLNSVMRRIAKKKLDANKFLKSQLDEFMDSTNISSHNLRHTYITRCAESGMNPSVLKKLVGHKDIETTLGTYTTVYENFTKK